MPTIYYSYNQVWTKKKSSNLKPIEFWITERKHNWNQSSEIYYFENYTSAFICFVLHLFPFGNSKFYLNVQGFTHAHTHTKCSQIQMSTSQIEFVKFTGEKVQVTHRYLMSKNSNTAAWSFWNCEFWNGNPWRNFKERNSKEMRTDVWCYSFNTV